MKELFMRLSLILIAVSLSIQTYGQHRLSAGARGGYPFSPQKELLNGINSLGRPLDLAAAVDVQYAYILPKTSYQGIGLSLLSLFDHEDVGTPLSLYVFQGARIARLSQSLSIDYEWNFGASFGWHRNKDYPFNTIMSTSVNAYVNGSIMLSWHSDDLNVSIGPDMTHYSNGHTEVPNAGLNMIGMRLTAARTIEGTKPLRYPGESWNESDRSGGFSMDITAFGALKKGGIEYLDMFYVAEGKFTAAGIHINPFYDLHKHFRIGLSLDLNYDESANLSSHAVGNANGLTGFYPPPLKEQIAAGLSARAELVMPIFSVQFGIGHNVIYKGADLAGLYQIIALKTHVTKNLYLHTGYQFRNFRNPDHLLLGLGWRFNNI
ncbi:MAG: acyloxyacyl hydrolase [Bacteroidales bacterium]|nr:acyloxyacyl hydrolase [Bacteroidales bacterium]